MGVVVDDLECRADAAGFTLAEVIIAVGLIFLLATGLYLSGIMVLKLTHFNRVSLEARSLGIQRLEEIRAAGLETIALQAPYAALTNKLMYGEPVTRTVQVIGHDTNGAVVAGLADSAYAEVHVRVAYYSPLTKSVVTNFFSTLVD